MSIQPAKTFLQELVPSENWVYTYLEQPFIEGIERLRRAWHGFNFHPTSTLLKISLRERVICLLSGFLLILPPLNLILWIFMKNASETAPLSLYNPFLGLRL